MFAWTSCFLLVYDLVNDKDVSRIYLNTYDIQSVCLFCDDKFVCCGLRDGKVSIFDKNNSKCILSFKANYKGIDVIDSLENFIVTLDSNGIRSWRLTRDEKSIYQCTQISGVKRDNLVSDLRLGLNGKNILINYVYKSSKKMQLLTFPDMELLKQYNFLPTTDGLKSGPDRRMFLVNEETRRIFDGGRELKFFSLLDAVTGEVIRKFNLDEDAPLLADHNSPSRCQGFAISEDNIFIIVYNRYGQIAKISLDLDEGLECILAKIKANLVKKKSKSESSCLIA